RERDPKDVRASRQKERKSASWNEIPEDNRRHVLLDEETRCEKPVAAQDHIDGCLHTTFISSSSDHIL
ncbi:hypothetical protein PISMIDRAFT_680802, partial [Pisolithus microcarpus 441]